MLPRIVASLSVSRVYTASLSLTPRHFRRAVALLTRKPAVAASDVKLFTRVNRRRDLSRVRNCCSEFYFYRRLGSEGREKQEEEEEEVSEGGQEKEKESISSSRGAVTLEVNGEKIQPLFAAECAPDVKETSAAQSVD